MAYTNKPTPRESNQCINKPHQQSNVKLLLVHAEPHRPTKIHFLLSKIRNEAIFFHVDPNQSMSSTTVYEEATTSKFLPIATNADLHQGKTSQILLTLYHTKPRYTSLSYRYI